MQLALVLPFMRLGELLLGAPYLPITPVSIKDVIWHHQGASATVQVAPAPPMGASIEFPGVCR